VIVNCSKQNKIKNLTTTIHLTINVTTYGIVDPGPGLGQIQKCHGIKLAMILSVSDTDDGYSRSASFSMSLISAFVLVK